MGCGPSRQEKKPPLQAAGPNNEGAGENLAPLEENKSTMTFKLEDPSMANGNPSMINMNAVSHDINGWVANNQQPITLPLPQGAPNISQLVHSNYAATEIAAPPDALINQTLVGTPLTLQAAKLVTHIVYEN